MKSPIRPTDDDALSLARDLMAGARFAALAYMDMADSSPMVSRVALVPGPDGMPLSLMSDRKSVM